MGTIQQSYDPTADVTLFDVQGFLTANELIAAFTAQMSERPTNDIIWYFHDADLSGFVTADMRRMIECARSFEKVRPDPRTVLVARGRIEAILFKLYSEIAKDARLRTSFHITDTRDKALAWLRSSTTG